MDLNVTGIERREQHQQPDDSATTNAYAIMDPTTTKLEQQRKDLITIKNTCNNIYHSMKTIKETEHEESERNKRVICRCVDYISRIAEMDRDPFMRLLSIRGACFTLWIMVTEIDQDNLPLTMMVKWEGLVQDVQRMREMTSVWSPVQ